MSSRSSPLRRSFFALVLLAVWPLLVAGCASLSAVSSGQIGCAQDEITISNESSGFGSKTWTAECRGRQFYCSAHQENPNSTAQVSCTEGLASSSDDAPATPAEDPADKACAVIYKHAAEFSPYWVAQSSGGVALDPPPEARDFEAVCKTLPENIRRCMFEGYRVSHKESCDAMLTRIDAPTRSKIDSLFLAAVAPAAAPSASGAATSSAASSPGP